MENSIESSIARKNQLELINRYLPENTSAPEETDIAYPEIGTILYNYFYAQKTGDTSFEEKADELLDVVLDEVNRNLPLYLEKGLCGLGCGLIYMIRNGLIEGDENEILEELDRIVRFNIVQYGNTKVSFWKGIYGWMYYLRKRITKHETNTSLAILLLKQDLISLIDKLYREKEINAEEINEIIKELEATHQLKIFPFKTGKLLAYYKNNAYL